MNCSEMISTVNVGLFFFFFFLLLFGRGENPWLPKDTVPPLIPIVSNPSPQIWWAGGWGAAM